LPGVAQVAMQQGTYAAKAIVRKLAGERNKALQYFDKGDMAVIGRWSAVAKPIWRRRFSPRRPSADDGHVAFVKILEGLISVRR